MNGVTQCIKASTFLGNEIHLKFLMKGVCSDPASPWLANNVVQTNDCEATKGNNNTDKEDSI